jgi:general secretion pathway protein C
MDHNRRIMKALSSSVRYLVTAGVWAAAAAVAVFWGLRLFVPAAPVPPQALAVAPEQSLRGDPARLFGAQAPVAGPAGAAEPALASRFRLLGVVAPAVEQAGVGVALLSIDGKPARAYRVGAVLDGSLVLQSVQKRSVRIGTAGSDSGTLLELPPPPAPATGNLAGMPRNAALAQAIPLTIPTSGPLLLPPTGAGRPPPTPMPGATPVAVPAQQRIPASAAR